MSVTNFTHSAWQICENLYAIEEGFVRCVLAIGDYKAMLVDSGNGQGNITEFAKTLTDKEIFLVNTHADGDHIARNGDFAEVYMHPAEYANYISKKRDGAAALSPLWDGGIKDLGTLRFEVIHIPGHTPGSIALLEREERILIGGDSVQRGTVLMVGPERNMSAYLCSMQRLEAMKHSFDRVLGGHGSADIGPDVVGDLITTAKALLTGELTGERTERAIVSHRYQNAGTSFIYY